MLCPTLLASPPNPLGYSECKHLLVDCSIVPMALCTRELVTQWSWGTGTGEVSALGLSSRQMAGALRGTAFLPVGWADSYLSPGIIIRDIWVKLS